MTTDCKRKSAIMELKALLEDDEDRLRVPRDRDGRFSTRKVKAIAEDLCGHSVSAPMMACRASAMNCGETPGTLSPAPGDEPPQPVFMYLPRV